MHSLCIYYMLILFALTFLTPAIHLYLTRIKIDNCYVIPCPDNYRDSSFKYDDDCITFIFANVSMINNINKNSYLQNKVYYTESFECYTNGDVGYIINYDIFLYMSIIICSLVFILFHISLYFNRNCFHQNQVICFIIINIIVIVLSCVIAYIIYATFIIKNGKCSDYSYTITKTLGYYNTKDYYILTRHFINNNIDGYFEYTIYNINNIYSQTCVLINNIIMPFEINQIYKIISYIMLINLYMNMLLIFRIVYDTCICCCNKPKISDVIEINIHQIETEQIEGQLNKKING